MTTRADVVAEARTWIRTGYCHGHRAKGHAVDCAGLVIGVARAIGIVPQDFDVNGYTRVPDGKSLLAICDQFMTRIPMAELQPADVLVLSFEHMPAHLGIVGNYLHGGPSLIHAHGTCDGRGHVVEWRLAMDRKGYRPIQAYAMPGVA